MFPYSLLVLRSISNAFSILIKCIRTNDATTENALARALAPKPRLILLDEPFSKLDSLKKATIQEEIVAIIKQTYSTGMFVTHDTNDVLAIADRVVVMKDAHSAKVVKTNFFGDHQEVICRVCGFDGKDMNVRKKS